LQPKTSNEDADPKINVRINRGLFPRVEWEVRFLDVISIQRGLCGWAHLGIPEVSGEVIALETKLNGYDFMHY
jgi:hypothetical protein